MENILKLQHQSNFNEFLIELIFSFMAKVSLSLDKDQDYIIARESLGKEWLLRQETKWFYALKNKLEAKLGFKEAKVIIDSIVEKVINKYEGK